MSGQNSHSRRRKPQPPRKGTAPNKRVRYNLSLEEAQKYQRVFFPLPPFEKHPSTQKIINQLREAGFVRPMQKIRVNNHAAVEVTLTKAGEIRMRALKLVNLPQLKNVPEKERMKIVVPVVLDIMHEIRLAELERMIQETVHDPTRAQKVRTTRYTPPFQEKW